VLETPDEWLDDLTLNELEQAIKGDGPTIYSATVGDLDYEMMISRSWLEAELSSRILGSTDDRSEVRYNGERGWTV